MKESANITTKELVDWVDNHVVLIEGYENWKDEVIKRLNEWDKLIRKQREISKLIASGVYLKYLP